MQGWGDVVDLWQLERRVLIQRLLVSILISCGVLATLGLVAATIRKWGFSSLPVGQASDADQQMVMHVVTVIIGLVGSSLASVAGRWFRWRILRGFVSRYRTYVATLTHTQLMAGSIRSGATLTSTSTTTDRGANLVDDTTTKEVRPREAERRRLQQDAREAREAQRRARTASRARQRMVDARARSFVAMLDIFAGFGTLAAALVFVILMKAPGLLALVLLMSVSVAILVLSFWNTNWRSGVRELAVDGPADSRYVTLVRQEAAREIQAPVFAATSGVVILVLAVLGVLVDSSSGTPTSASFLITGFVIGASRGVWVEGQQLPRSIGRFDASMSDQTAWDDDA